jgi:hypothetical protein
VLEHCLAELQLPLPLAQPLQLVLELVDVLAGADEFIEQVADVFLEAPLDLLVDRILGEGVAELLPQVLIDRLLLLLEVLQLLGQAQTALGTGYFACLKLTYSFSNLP